MSNIEDLIKKRACCGNCKNENLNDYFENECPHTKSCLTGNTTGTLDQWKSCVELPELIVSKSGTLQAVIDASAPIWNYATMDDYATITFHEKLPSRNSQDTSWQSTGAEEEIPFALFSQDKLKYGELVTRTGYIEPYVCPFTKGQPVLVWDNGEKLPRVFHHYDAEIKAFYVYGGSNEPTWFAKCEELEL